MTFFLSKWYNRQANKKESKGCEKNLVFLSNLIFMSFYQKGGGMKEKMEQENILGKEKIGKLILKFSIPCIVSMLVNSLYNIVD